MQQDYYRKAEVHKWLITLKNGRKLKCVACIEDLIDAMFGSYVRIERY